MTETQNPSPATPDAAASAPATISGVPKPTVIPIPPPPSESRKYLTGLIATLVISGIAVIVATAIGGKLIPDRFTQPTVADEVEEGRDIRIEHTRVASPDEPENRAISFKDSDMIGRDPKDVDPEYLRLVAERVAAGPKPKAPPIEMMGDPLVIVETWLQGMRDLDLIVRYDQQADETVTSDDGTPVRKLYYSVNSYAGFTRDKVVRELFRFEFVRMADLAKSFEAHLRELEAGNASPIEIEQMRETIQRLRKNTTDYQLLTYGQVPPSDTDYATYMNR